MVARDVSDRRRAEEEDSRVKEELLERESALRQALVALRTSHEELKQAQLQLIQSAKLESVGRLAAGVAHEVKNPLAVILSGTEYLMGDPTVARPEIQPVLEDIRVAVGRANDVIMGLLNYSAATELKPSEADPNEVLRDSVRLVQHALVRSHLTVEEHLAPHLPKLSLDVNKLQQVIVNLLMNAIDATPEGGRVTIRTRRKQLAASDAAAGFRRTDALRVGDSVVLVSVEDTGTGFPPAGLPKVFDPFFTTKPTGKGTGLGLAVSKTIVALHGGTIWAANRPEGGAVVTVVLRSPSSAQEVMS
jgi:signal transduction histidine kinase